MQDDNPADGDAERLAGEIVRDVAELPDRTSPDDQPDALMVTRQELRLIVLETLRPILDARDADLREAKAETRRIRDLLQKASDERQLWFAEAERLRQTHDASLLRMLNACDVDMREKNLEIERLRQALAPEVKP